MDSVFFPLQNFTVISFIALGIVLISFLVEAKSNSPYKSLLLSNIGFGIYYFTFLNGSEIDFPIYFMLLSFLICSWFFVIKNIEEEEDEDRGYWRTDYTIISNDFESFESENCNEVPLLNKSSFFPFSICFGNILYKIFASKMMLFMKILLKNDTVHYIHPQRKLIHSFTYLILISILFAFFYV